MRILILSGGYPTSNTPLNGVFAFDQAKALKSLGMDILFVSMDLRSIRRKRKFGLYWDKKDGVDIINFSIPVGRLPINLLCWIGQKALLRMYRDIIKHYGKPDIIHAHFAYIGKISLVLKKKHDIPIVMTEHNSEISEPILKKSVFNLGTQTYPHVNKVFAVSAKLADKINQYWNIEAQVINNIVDTSVFKYSKNNNAIIKGYTFLSIGNLIQRKGFDLLINAFSLANFDSNVYLKIVGEGAIQQDLQALIDNKGLSNNIELCGFLKREEIANLMLECDGFVLASRAETFGVVYIEAMASGLPVIATACGGPEDFVNNTNGILIPIDNVNSLKDALIKMRNSTNIYDNEKISEQCKLIFSPEVIAQQLLSAYKNILDKNHNEKV